MDERIIFEYFTICSLQQCIEYRYTVRKSKIENGPNGTELPCTKFKKIVYAIEREKITTNFTEKMPLQAQEKRIAVRITLAGCGFKSPFLFSCLNCCYSVISNHFFVCGSQSIFHRQIWNALRTKYLQHGNGISGECSLKWAEYWNRARMKLVK